MLLRKINNLKAIKYNNNFNKYLKSERFLVIVC